MQNTSRILRGVVIEGSKRASLLGYPTLNISVDTDSVEAGVYLGMAEIYKKEYRAAVFVDPSRGLLEAHLIDFAGEAYGEQLMVEIIEKIRDTEIFKDDALLKQAIGSDVAYVRTHQT